MGRRVLLEQRYSPSATARAQCDLCPNPVDIVDERHHRFEPRARTNQRSGSFGRSRLRGAVIAGTTEKRVKSLVYVAALAPDQDETVANVFYRDEPHPEAPKLAPDTHGFLWMAPDGFRRAVAHRASTDQTNIMGAVQRPIALACIQEPAPVPAWKTIPSWFLLAEEDRMINPKTQRFMAERMGAKVRSHYVDHSPMYTEPNLVIDAILEAARETLSLDRALSTN
jgi:pimeloyl-ACP methyl ester carboxylesterase